MSEPMALVASERDGDIAILTMRSAPLNLLGCDLGRMLVDEISSASHSGARAVILRSGLRHFCAGADMRLFDGRGAKFRSEFDALGVMRAFERCPLPIVASVNGAALGGGLELALLCDFIVAGAGAKFGLVEANLGLHPLMGGVQRVVERAGVGRAKEMVMLARRYDGQTLERWGIVNQVVPDDQLDSASMAVAAELAHGPTVAHACTKRLVDVYLRDGLLAADDAMAEIQGPIWESKDLAIGLTSFASNGPGNATFLGR